MPHRPFAPRFQDPGTFNDPVAWWAYGIHIAWDLFLVLAVILVVILLVRAFSHRPAWGGSHHHNAALAELDLRYARGELTREEYFQRRADLSGTPAGPAPAPPTPPAKKS